MIALSVLSVLSLFAATAVALRMDLDGQAERSLAALCLWFALILTPIYALGFVHLLAPTPLFVASAALSVVVTAASFRGLPWRSQAQLVAREIGGTVSLPMRALRVTMADKSLAFAAVVVVLLVLVWSVIATYLAPSDGWDGIGYHEAIVGYAIQNRGFEAVSLPNDFYNETINGYPRHSEMTSLWLVIFGDRRLIELPNTLGSPVFLLSMYLLCRRYGEAASTSIGWACASLLMPGTVLLLRSTYIDVHALGFIMAALHFTTRPGLRVKDGWIASICLALMFGVKSMGASWGVLLAVTVLGRLIALRRGQGRQVALTVAGGAAIVIALGAPIYLRNWVLFKNPIWPASFQIASLGLSFPGNLSLAKAYNDNHPIAIVWAQMIAPFKPGLDFADTRVFGYGIAAPLLLLPLACVAGALCVWELALDLLVRARRSAARPGRALDWTFLYIFVFGVITAVFSPALWQARYNLHVAAVLSIACAYLSGQRGFSRASEGAMAVTFFANALYLMWADPGLQPGVREMTRLAAMRPEVRAAERQNPWTLDKAVARRRDTELGPGALTLYTDRARFIGTFWNETFTNRVEYVRGASAEATFKEIEARRPKWVITVEPVARFFARDPTRWRLVGAMSAGSAAGTVAYERLGDP